jgi:tetratricopeptide (TPR) repeat protein
MKRNLVVQLQKQIQNAWGFFRKGFMDEALKIGEEVLKRNPGNIEAIYILGLVYLKNGEITKAIEYLLIVNKNNTFHYEALGNLGLAYHEAGQTDLAQNYYQKALSINAGYLDAYYNLHAIQIDQGKEDEAINSLEKLITLNPNDLDACFMLALLKDHFNESSTISYFKNIENKSTLIDARIDAWNYIKNSCKYKIQLTGSSINTFEIAMNFSNPDGLILEFGVRHGSSINQLASLTNQTIYGFDSFEGLKERWHHESKGSYSTKGILPEVKNNVTLYKGWFDEVLPIFLEEHNGYIKLINIDCDTYQSTKIVLDLLAPRIQPGTIIIFDEYIGNQHWKEDEFKAFQEAVNKNKWSFKYLALSFFTKQVVVKIL